MLHQTLSVPIMERCCSLRQLFVCSSEWLPVWSNNFANCVFDVQEISEFSPVVSNQKSASFGKLITSVAIVEKTFCSVLTALFYVIQVCLSTPVTSSPSCGDDTHLRRRRGHLYLSWREINDISRLMTISSTSVEIIWRKSDVRISSFWETVRGCVDT